MAADHQALVRALVALGFDKGNVNTSLRGLEAKGWVRSRGRPAAGPRRWTVTREGRNRVAALTASCE